MPTISRTMPTISERIVAATEALLASHGVGELRVEDLLQATGVSRRTFYKYFSSKEAAVARVYEQVTEEIAAAIREAEFDLDDPLAGIRQALDAYLGVVAAHQGVLGPLLEEAIRSDSALAPIRRGFREQLTRTMELVFAATLGRRVDPFVFAALISALEGLCIERLAAGEPLDTPRIRAACLACLEAVARCPEVLPAPPGAPASSGQ